MEKVICHIWEDTAEIEVPQSFAEATVGERRKVYGLRSDIPTQMLIDREKRVFISSASVSKRLENSEQRELVEWAQILNHTLERNVPGYKCMGIYKREIAGKNACAIQYTFYAQELNRYTLLVIIEQEDNLCMLNFVCNNEQVPQMHPMFLEIIESIKFKEK